MPKPNKGVAGSTDQQSGWQGRPEYSPADFPAQGDDKELDRGLASTAPEERDLSDLTNPSIPSSEPSREDRIRFRAQRLWEQSGQLDGSHEDYIFQAERDIDIDDQFPDGSAEARSPEEERRPAEVFPPFDDPAFSPKPAQPPVQPDTDRTTAPKE